MPSSILGTGGYGTIPSTATAAAPATLYDAIGITATADGGACNVFSVVNHDPINWLWVRVPGIHANSQGVPVMPGERLPIQRGSNGNNLNMVQGWATLPNSTTTASATLVVSGGIQGEK